MKPAPTNSRNLSCFAIDVDHFLEQTGLFSKIKMKKTGEAKCALLVICTVANPSTTQAEVAQALERAWNEAPLNYAEGQNSRKITTLTGGVQMHFSTATAELAVTGRIEVMGFN